MGVLTQNSLLAYPNINSLSLAGIRILFNDLKDIQLGYSWVACPDGTCVFFEFQALEQCLFDHGYHHDSANFNAKDEGRKGYKDRECVSARDSGQTFFSLAAQ
jgi:hypothetical protein